MAEIFDIVKLIERDPISRLSEDYQNKLLKKIKKKFTGKEQQLFVSQFYCYLNYNTKKDFVVDLDNIWKWIGCVRKEHAKILLEKHFVEGADFIKKENNEENKDKRTNNKEKILMTISTFKKLCMKAHTKETDNIHDYYIKLEDLLLETISEESEDLKRKLQKKDKQLKRQMSENEILKNLLKNKECVYLEEIAPDLIKISSYEIDNIGNKMHDIFGKCTYLDSFECSNVKNVEKNILVHPEIVINLHKEKINGILYNGVVKLSGKFDYNQLSTIVKERIEENKNNNFSSEKILEEQRISLEKQKLKNKSMLEQYKSENEFLIKMSNDKEYEGLIKEKLNKILDNMIQRQINVNHMNESDDIDINCTHIKKVYPELINKNSDDDVKVNNKSLKKLKKNKE
jgi:hypothetical protein